MIGVGPDAYLRHSQGKLAQPDAHASLCLQQTGKERTTRQPTTARVQGSVNLFPGVRRGLGDRPTQNVWPVTGARVIRVGRGQDLRHAEWRFKCHRRFPSARHRNARASELGWEPSSQTKADEKSPLFLQCAGRSDNVFSQTGRLNPTRSTQGRLLKGSACRKASMAGARNSFTWAVFRSISPAKAADDLALNHVAAQCLCFAAGSAQLDNLESRCPWEPTSGFGKKLEATQF